MAPMADVPLNLKKKDILRDLSFVIKGVLDHFFEVGHTESITNGYDAEVCCSL